MNLPAPVIDQGAGTVQIPFCDCRCAPLTVSIYASARSGSAVFPPPTGVMPAPPTALEAYNASAFAEPLASSTFDAATASYTMTGSTTTHSGGSTTAYTYRNTGEGAAGSTTYIGLRYKLRVDFGNPWLGTASVVISWREKTELQTGTLTAVEPDDGSAGTETVSESASETYAAMSETLTPAAGDTFAETAEHTIEATSLTLGATVRIVGPADPALLTPVFGVVTSAQNVAKYGFISYVQAETTAGALVNPQPVYTRETATVAPDAAPDTMYSGYQDTSTGSVLRTDDFETTVPSRFWSAVNDNEPYTPGQELETNEALCNIRQAVSVLPAAVEWPQGLLMTLSNEQTTASIQATADTALAAFAWPSGQVLDGQTAGVVIAARNLPAHEQFYTTQKGVYSVVLDLEISGGLASLFAGQPPPLTSSGSVTLAWTREIIDLDTGARSSTTPALDVAFTGVPGSATPVFSGVPATPSYEPTFASLPYVENPPATNQRVEISGLTITSAALDCLAIPPQAQVVPAAPT